MNGVGCMVALGTIHDWAPTPGAVVTWKAAPGARAIAAQAPITDVPASFQQSQHLRGFATHAAKGRDMARLAVGAWDISGICDIPAMTEAITAHLRRQDAYHSWFEYENANNIVRRTIRNPADIELDAIEHGHLSLPELRANIFATADLTEWGCFSFGIIQRADHFTFYTSM